MEIFTNIVLIAVITLVIYCFYKKILYWKYVFGTPLYYFILFSGIVGLIITIKTLWN